MKQQPKIALAPMEGLADFYIRQMLTRIGGFDHCVTEFIRVSELKLPPRTFYRYCPELRNGGKTLSGTPTHVQLLGSNPEAMAQNAELAAELGAPCIDINFGCPAKTINRHRGGAILLQEPELIYRITQQVRAAVASPIPVTVKMRLGYLDNCLALENASAIEQAGASHLTIHARTKSQGYAPPAYWEQIAEIKKQLQIPIYANGEIWNVQDYRRCVAKSQCNDVMLGRGAVTTPDLALQIKNSLNPYPQLARNKPQPWLGSDARAMIVEYLNLIIDTGKPKQIAGRIKQWLGFLAQQYEECAALFLRIKKLKDPQEVFRLVYSAS